MLKYLKIALNIACDVAKLYEVLYNIYIGMLLDLKSKTKDNNKYN